MDIIQRIKRLIEDSDLSSAAFADKLGVQRSSISHILSGRNKPSLDFVMKLLEAFPTVSPDWLLLGNKEQNKIPPMTSHLFSEQQEMDDLTENSPEPQIASLSTSKEPNAQNPDVDAHNQIERIVVLYTDGTFGTYINKK